MRDLANLELSPDRFPDLLALCALDQQFPKNWLGWQELQINARKAADASGIRSAPLRLEVEPFRNWCTKVGIVPCIDALRAFAIVQRAGFRSPPSGSSDAPAEA